MKIGIEENDGIVTIKPEGNIDFLTAPELDAVIEKQALSAKSLVFDFAAVPYIASAGLRSILNADELMEDKEGIRIIHVNKNVMAVFEMTGFTAELDIE
ncbi:MAG TPA: STAS domain-containing protein [Methanocorpusculum sp.]|nr:STAS domain-containing protein [Methanocorpusculum sp.]